MVYEAPYGPDGSLLRVATPDALWLASVPFHATLTFWDMEWNRYVVLRDMASGSTYPINWSYWWPGDAGGGMHLGVSGRKPTNIASTYIPGPEPADFPLRHGKWHSAEAWRHSWTGWWRVRRRGLAYAVELAPAPRQVAP